MKMMVCVTHIVSSLCCEFSPSILFWLLPPTPSPSLSHPPLIFTEFDYDALGDDDFDDSDDGGGGAKGQATEQEMEKLLLDNMSSEEEGGEEKEIEPAKKKRKQRLQRLLPMATFKHTVLF